MKNLSHLITPEQASRYKKMTAYEKLMEELRATSMVTMENTSNNI
jgi:hypothetical protein